MGKSLSPGAVGFYYSTALCNFLFFQNNTISWFAVSIQDGHAIGINAITVRFAAGISFSIPIDTAKDFLSGAIERVKSGKYLGRNTRQPLAPHQRWYIGVSMLTLTPQILAELRRRDQSFNKITSGVFVPQVNYGSPAHR